MTEIFWYIVHLIVAVFAFRFGFRTARNLADYRRSTENIEREIPFTLFLEAYGKAPDRWICLPYHVRYGKDDVRFENYADYRKYQKWREKRKQDEATERKREANEALYREIKKDISPNPNFTPPPTARTGGYHPRQCEMPKPPTTGSCAINRKSETAGKEYIYVDLASDLKNGRYMILNGEHPTVITESGFAIRNYKLPSDVADEIEAQGKRYKLHRKEFSCLSYDCIYRIIDNTPPPTAYKPTTREAVLEEIKKYTERKQWGGNPLEKAIEQMILNQIEQGPKSGNFGNCGNCICYRQRTQVDGYCDTHRTVTQATSSCPLYIEAGKEHRKKCGVCGKCRQFDKGDNSPFGYCFRNDEIVNETSVEGCFEPKSEADERPEPLGTVTTN